MILGGYEVCSCALPQNSLHAEGLNAGAVSTLQVHTFDPFLSTDTEASVQGRPGLQFHAVGVLGSADGRVGTESPEKWQSLESIMLDLQHEWLEVPHSLGHSRRSSPAWTMNCLIWST